MYVLEMIEYIVFVFPDQNNDYIFNHCKAPKTIT